MHNYKQLTVWQDAVDFAKDIYLSTNNFPTEEKFGLTSQIRRAAVSIASNIAEGSCRNTNKEFIHFLGVAAGSTAEVETQIIIAWKLGLLTQNIVEILTDRSDKISNKIWKLKSSLK